MSSDDSASKLTNDWLNIVDLHNFWICKNIGRTKIFKFYKIKNKETNQKYAAKVLCSCDEDENDEEKKLDDFKRFLFEVELLSTFNSPFIMKCLGINFLGFDEDHYPTAITEYFKNGTLDNLIRTKMLDETNKLCIIYGIASGMALVHSKGIINHDLKPSNIFIDDFLLPKIGNFMSATFIDNKSMYDAIGKLHYMAPELIYLKEYDQSIDIYSFAITVYEIMTGKMPKIRLLSIAQGEMPEIELTIPESYRNLIMRCMSYDPKDRPTFDEIVSLLKTDKGFITPDVDEEKFYKLIESVEGHEYEPEIIFDKVEIDYQEFKKLNVKLDPINLDLFEKKSMIGRGSYGKVYKIKDKKTDADYSAKVIFLPLESCELSKITNLSREINIISKLDSPLVVKFIGFSPDDFEGLSSPTIITEYLENKSLDEIIRMQKNGLTPKEWDATKQLCSVYGIASGMAYLHKLNILHRDLKPANVFCDEHLFPKIGDFGLSVELEGESKFEGESIEGSLMFMAPEILLFKTYSKASDVYAFAILLYQITTLITSYKGLSPFQLVHNAEIGKRLEFDVLIPSCYKDLIEKCWSQKPENRPTFDEIVSLLENDKDFITDEIDAKEFFKYVNYVKEKGCVDSFPNVTLDFEELRRIQEKNQTLNVKPLDLNQFEKMNLIRKDENFKICEVKNKETGILYEAKISLIKITDMSKTENAHLSREISILSKLSHPSFIKFIGYSPFDFEQLLMPVIITEKPPNKSLFQLLTKLRNEKKVDEWNDTKKLIFIYGIASGMSFLHSFDVIHRNLCPESIFIDEYLHPKIGNFGLLKRIHTEESMTHQTEAGVKGNFIYSSPELLETNSYSKCSDVYAFALIVYEILTLETPFKKVKSFTQLFNEVINKTTRPEFKSDDEIGIGYRRLIENCWSQNPEERPTFDEIESILKNDPIFITSSVDEKEFNDYVRFIKKSKKDFSSKNSDQSIHSKSKSDDSGRKSKDLSQSIKSDDSLKSRSSSKDKDFDSKSKSRSKDDNLKSRSSSKDEDCDFISKSRSKDDNLKSRSSSKDKDSDLKSKSISKNSDDNSKSKSSTIDDDFDDSDSSISIEVIDSHTETLLKKRCIGTVDYSFIDYLLSYSEPIGTSLTTSNFKIQIGDASSESDFVRLEVLKKKYCTKMDESSRRKEKKFDSEKVRKFIKMCEKINKISHPNLAKSLGFYEGSKNHEPTILYEFYATNLRDVVQSISSVHLVTLVFEISHAMMTAHAKNLIHRNLSIDCIFVDAEKHAKVSGFGFPIFVSESEQAESASETPLCLPHEILQNKEYDEKVDVFSFGMIMLFILRRGKGSYLTREEIESGKKPKVPKSLNKLSYSIIAKCLSYEKDERPRFKAIVDTIVRNEFKLIDGIEKKISRIKNHLKSIIDQNAHKK